MTLIDPETRGWRVSEDRVSVMGVVNCTPDSFSDGVSASRMSAELFIDKALALCEDGADILDIGGESTRPGSHAISVEEELERVIPVIRGIRARLPVPISIDTRKAAVAALALDAGASVVNDVSGFRFDPEMQMLVSERKPDVIVMHSRGTPETMQSPPHTHYTDLIAEIRSELRERCAMLESWGLRQEQICIDPGFGFAKTSEDNLRLLENLHRLDLSPYPMLVALSRKAFLGKLSGEADARKRNPAGRDPETLAALALAYTQGFRFFRVHNVRACRRFFNVYEKVFYPV